MGDGPSGAVTQAGVARSDTETGDEVGDEGPQRTGRVGSRAWRLVTLAGLLAAVCAINLGHMWRYPELSPIDEAQHLDSLIRIPRGELIGSGERMGQETLRIETCHRIDSPFDAAVPPCDPNAPPLDATTFQEEGYNTAYVHPPTYYFVDGTLARVIDFVLPGEHDLLTTGRLAGMIWVVGAVVFLWLLLDELGAGLLGRSALILIAATAPNVLLGTATVNLDGTALATGAAVLWAALRWERGRASAWLPLAFAAVAAATKVTNLVGVGVVVLYLLSRAVLRSRRSADDPLPAVGSASAPNGAVESVAGAPRRTSAWTPARIRERFWATGSPAKRDVALVGGLLIVLGTISIAWYVVQKSVEVVAPSTVPMVYRYYFDKFPLAEMATSWHQTVSPFWERYIPPFLQNRAVLATAGVVDLLMVAGPAAGTILAPRGSRGRVLGGSVLVLLPLAGPALVLLNALVQQTYVVIPSRYALSLVPGLLAAMVPAMRWKIPLGIVTAVAAVAVLGVAAAIISPVA